MEIQSEPSVSSTLYEIKTSKEEPSLQKCVVYADNRSQCVFSDGTALILHPGADCFTFFHENGRKERQMVAYATRKNKILAKLRSALSFYNHFASTPVQLLEEQVPAKEREQRLVKLTSSCWTFPARSHDSSPGVNAPTTKSKLSVDKQGNLKLHALNNEAKLTLAKNGFLFKIEFLQLLPTKE